MKISTFVGILLLGCMTSFAIGWQLKSSLILDKNNKFVPAQMTSVASGSNGENRNRSVGVVDKLGKNTEQVKTKPIASKPESSDFDQALKQLDQFSQRLQNGEYSEEMDEQLGGFMQLVIELGKNRYGEDETKFNRLATKVLESELVFGAFLAYYPKISNNSDQTSFASVFLNPKMVNSPFRENFILDKIKSDEQASVWLKTLSSWGVQEASTVDYLLDQIPYIKNPNDLAAAITASTNVVRPRGLSDSEFIPARDDAAPLYQRYFDSEEDVVRAAAIGSLIAFPRENTEVLVDQAMSDASPKVKQRALSVIRAQGLNSPSIMDSMFALILDKDAPLYLRSAAVFTLSETAAEGSISQEIVETSKKIRQMELDTLRGQP